MSVNSRMHTGCPCWRCRQGRNKVVRREFSKRRRLRHKRQLRKFGDIIDVDISIGYTD